MKSGAIAISLPFSCILGLLASMTSTTMGNFLSIVSFLRISLSVLPYLVFLFSKEKICLALRYDSIRTGGSFRSSFLLIGKI